MNTNPGGTVDTGKVVKTTLIVVATLVGVVVAVILLWKGITYQTPEQQYVNCITSTVDAGGNPASCPSP